MRVLSVGATGETSSDLLDLQDEQLLDRLQSYIKSGSQFDSRTNPGAPIGIVMRYVGSVTDTSGPGTIAIAQMVTDNSPEVVNVTTKKTCQREDGTPYVYSVWDGAGGGTVDTGIDLLPGDHVEITATGENQSGVFGTGTYGPNGWDDKAPFGAGANAFPVQNHHPFALIARIGAVARIGNDALGNTGDRDKPRDDTTSLYGTWFFVGAGQSLWVGRRRDEGGVQSYGRLYLATNDNNPLNGDPKYKFSVSVCYTPANPTKS